MSTILIKDSDALSVDYWFDIFVFQEWGSTHFLQVVARQCVLFYLTGSHSQHSKMSTFCSQLAGYMTLLLNQPLFQTID